MLPGNRKQPPVSRGHKPAAINEHHEKSRLAKRFVELDYAPA
jgi:hypothetical protein